MPFYRAAARDGNVPHTIPILIVNPDDGAHRAPVTLPPPRLRVMNAEGKTSGVMREMPPS